MKAVYLAHPLNAPTRAGIDANRARASRWAAWAAVIHGVSPVCSWIVLTGQLEETDENRARGLACDLAQAERCDEVWLVGGRVSSGMRLEADHAAARGIPVLDLTHMGEEPPPFAELRRPEVCPTCLHRTDPGKMAPKRRFEIIVSLSADDWQTAKRELADLAEHIADHGPECTSVSGGPSSGHFVVVTERPEQTHEKWEGELELFLAELEAEEKAVARAGV
jgi:hypothetical protein